MSCFRRWRVLVLVSLMLISGKRISPPEPQQDPFQIATFCTPVPAGQRQVTATTGDDLQRALDQAVAGDTIPGWPTAPHASSSGSGWQLPAAKPPNPGRLVVNDSLRELAHSTPTARCRPQPGSTSANANLMPKLRAIATNKPAHTRRSRRARLSADRPRQSASMKQVAHLSNLVELGSGRRHDGRNFAVRHRHRSLLTLHGERPGRLPARYRAQRRPDGCRRFLSRELPRRAQRFRGAIGGWNGRGTVQDREQLSRSGEREHHVRRRRSRDSRNSCRPTSKFAAT